MKKTFFIFIFLLTSVFLFAEKVYKLLPDGSERWVNQSLETREYIYDDSGKILYELAKVYKEPRRIDYLYNDKGFLIKKVLSSNSYIMYDYDEKGRLIYEKTALGTTITEEWSDYDKNGNLIKKTDSNKYLSLYKYDSQNRMIEEIGSGPYIDKYKVVYEYNSDNLKSHSYHYSNLESNEIEREEWFEYDNFGNLIHLKNSKNFEEWYEYDEHGKRIHTKNTNGEEYWW